LRTKVAVVLATFFGCGFVPVAPGTAGALAAVPIWWALTHVHPAWQVVAVAVSVGAGTWAAHLAGRHFGVVDSPHIVVDEVAGLLITALFVPFSWPNALAVFALFRVLDVVKPWPASYFDRKVKNGFGVVMDDVAAGVYGRAIMLGLSLAWPAVFAPAVLPR
jgi:phosphatidylglycerophosphatase A